MCFEVLEDVLPEDHRARLLWGVVETLDVGKFLRNRRAFEGRAGRSVTSPQVLLTLWLYAISEGIGSAREIERRIGSDDAFRWIAGNEAVGRTTLSEFRATQGQAFDELLTEILGTLLHKGLVSLALVAQDGTRVRAAASAPSFRSAAGLAQCLEQARLHVKAVFAEADDPEVTERERRVQEAIAELARMRAEGKPDPRASTTDSDARVMKMGDGGFRPAYNVQFATAGDADGGPRTIVGVRVTNKGSDIGSITPMLDQVETRTGHMPDVLLADGGHLHFDCVRKAAERGVDLIMPLPRASTAPTSRTAANDPAIVAWREGLTGNRRERPKARPGERGILRVF
jgi:transposase